MRIRVPYERRDGALFVSERAIGVDQSGRYVLVVNKDDVVEYRQVETGARQPGGLQVAVPVKLVRTEGGFRPAREGEKGEDSLKPGDRVIVGGLQRVRPGMKVEARPREPVAQ